MPLLLADKATPFFLASLSIRHVFGGTEKIAQSVKYFLCRHKDLNLEHSLTVSVRVVWICTPKAESTDWRTQPVT